MKIFERLKNKKGTLDPAGILIDIVLLVALIPIIVTFFTTGSFICTNETTPFYNETSGLCQVEDNSSINSVSTRIGLSPTEQSLMGLTALFLILALVFSVVKQSGLTQKK